MRTMALVSCLALGLSACAYRRHTTPLHLEPSPKLQQGAQPGYTYGFRVLSAVVPANKISGLAWDDDGSGPDCFVRLYVDERKVWESEPQTDKVRPEWNVVLPRNIVVGPESKFRLEVWDFDTALSADPIGRIERMGLPTTAVPGAMARLTLDSKATIVVLVTEPRAHRGVGVTVEVRSDALVVLSVEPYSPAARAGIRAGDLIVGIGGERVAHMEDDDAVSQLSLAHERKHKLAVTNAEGKNEREIALDDGYVWLVM